MKKFINIIIGIVLLIMGIMNCILVRDLEQKTLELIELTDVEPPLIIVDNLVHDTVYIKSKEKVKLPIVDTLVLTDTLVAVTVDSVFVEVPISTYYYDTTLSQTHISLICDGFDVRLNSLLVERINVAQKQEKAVKKWHDNFGFGFGLGVTYIDRFRICPNIGLYYKLM